MRRHYRVILELIAAKNPMLVEDIKRKEKDMETIWMDIFSDAIDEKIHKRFLNQLIYQLHFLEKVEMLD